MNKSFYGSAFGLAAIIFFLIAFAYGWVMNIVALSHMASALSGFGVLRIAGIFIPPLGGVLGFL